MGQKTEDRLRLCKANDVEKLSSDEMKLWLQRRGGRVPDGDVTSDADRKKMVRLIRNRMRVTTPCFKAKAPPKRPKKGRNTGFIRRNAAKPVVAVAVKPIVAVHSQSLSMCSPPRNDFNNASMEPMMGTPPSDRRRGLCAYSATPSRTHRNDYEAKEPETPQIPRFAMAPPQTPQIAQNFTSNSFRTPKFGTPKCSSVMETPSLMHSIAGYMTMALVGLTYAMGLVLYVLKWGAELRGTLKPLHKRLGFMALLMGYATILMGMTEKANGMEGLTLQFTQVIVGLVVSAAVCVSFSVMKFVDKKDGGDFKYTPIIEEDSLVHLM